MQFDLMNARSLQNGNGSLADAVVCGRRLKSLDLPGFRVCEAVCDAARIIPSQVHPSACLCLTLGGGYSIERGRSRLQCGPATLVLHAPGQAYGTRISEAVSHCLIVAMDQAALTSADGGHVDFERLSDMRRAPPHWLAFQLRSELQLHDDLSAMALPGIIVELLAELEERPALETRSTSARAADACCATTQAKTSPRNVSPARVSIFQVPLVCLGAPQIGCGPRAKPRLLELERDSSVSEAWLNRAGTEIAVVWEAESKAKARRSVATKLKEHEAVEIKGKPRDKAIADFLSGNGWFRGADVDRLSDEEVGIIVARWVKRVQAKTTLPKEKAEALHGALTDAVKKRLTTMSKEKGDALHDAVKNRPTDDSTKQELNAFLNPEGGLQKVASQYLDKDQMLILEEAIKAGPRPLANEETSDEPGSCCSAPTKKVDK